MADLVAGVVGVEHPAALVEDQAALLVEGNALDRDAGVADRAQDQAALELLALAAVPGAQRAALLDQLVAADDDLLDLAVALDLDRRGEEAEDDPLLLPSGSRWENSRRVSTLTRVVLSASSDSR